MASFRLQASERRYNATCHELREDDEMAHSSRLEIKAGDLRHALSIVVPTRRKNARRTKPWPLSLSFEAESQALSISGVNIAAKSHQIAATGRWPSRVQVDGQNLKKIAVKYHARDVLYLVATRDGLSIQKSGSCIDMPRLDAKGAPGYDEIPAPPDPRHTGPIAVPPDTNEKRFEWADTWDFSARVPFPQHRKPQG